MAKKQKKDYKDKKWTAVETEAEEKFDALD